MSLIGLHVVVLLVSSGAPPLTKDGTPPEVQAGSKPMNATTGSRAAIDAALDRLYPTEKDFRFALKPNAGETEAPLAEVVVYRSSKPTPHWHYITYGLTELSGKTSSDPKLSGFGVEYTLRLVDQSAEPPAWPINLLRWVAKRVWETRQPYDPGHSMNLPGKMLEQYSKGVEGLGFFEDEELHAIDTASGRVSFVDVIPLMTGEYTLMGEWDAYKVATEIRSLQHDLLWRSGRKSCLDGERGKVIRAMVDKEGSSQSVDFADLPCGPTEIVLDSVGRIIFDKFLRHRLAHGRDAKVISGEQTTDLVPGAWKFSFSKKACLIQVPVNEARALADEISKAGNGLVIKRTGGIRLRIDNS